MKTIMYKKKQLQWWCCLLEKWSLIWQCHLFLLYLRFLLLIILEWISWRMAVITITKKVKQKIMDRGNILISASILKNIIDPVGKKNRVTTTYNNSIARNSPKKGESLTEAPRPPSPSQSWMKNSLMRKRKGYSRLGERAISFSSIIGSRFQRAHLKLNTLHIKVDSKKTRIRIKSLALVAIWHLNSIFIVMEILTISLLLALESVNKMQRKWHLKDWLLTWFKLEVFVLVFETRNSCLKKCNLKWRKTFTFHKYPSQNLELISKKKSRNLIWKEREKSQRNCKKVSRNRTSLNQSMRSEKSPNSSNSNGMKFHSFGHMV